MSIDHEDHYMKMEAIITKQLVAFPETHNFLPDLQ